MFRKILLIVLAMTLLVTSGTVIGCSKAETTGTYSASTTQKASPDDIEWLATVIASEAGSVWDVDHWVTCTDEERAAVGSTVLNRLSDGTFGGTVEEVVTAQGQYAHNQQPTEEIRTLSKKLLEEGIPDSTGGATHFFSPISMPKEGENTSGFDIGGGLQEVTGITKKVYFPSWTKTMAYVGDLNNVRRAYFMFYRPKEESVTIPSEPIQSGQPVIKWKAKLEGETNRRFLVASGIVYVPSNDQYLYALDVATGNLMWKFKTESEPSTPAVMGRMILTGDYRYIYALDATTGTLVWQFETDADKQPNVLNGVVYIRDTGGVHALDLLTGSEKWYFETECHVFPLLMEVANNGVLTVSDDTFYLMDASSGELIWSRKSIEDVSPSSIVITSDTLVYDGWNSPRLCALDIATGQPLWQFGAEDMLMLFQGAVDRDTIYVSEINKGIVYAIDTDTGKTKWQYSVGGRYGPCLLPLQDDTLYISTSIDVHAVDVTNGRLKWKIDTTFYKHSDLELVAGSMLYFADTGSQSIYTVEAQTGKLKWTFDRVDDAIQTGREYSGVVVVDDMVYFGTHDGWVYAVEAP